MVFKVIVFAICMDSEADETKMRNRMINGTIHGMKVSSLVDFLRTATHEEGREL